MDHTIRWVTGFVIGGICAWMLHQPDEDESEQKPAAFGMAAGFGAGFLFASEILFACGVVVGGAALLFLAPHAIRAVAEALRRCHDEIRIARGGTARRALPKLEELERAIQSGESKETLLELLRWEKSHGTRRRDRGG